MHCQLINILCPLLHHLMTLGKIFSAVVGRAHLVAFAMGKLALDHVRVEAQLVQQGRRRRAKPVAGGPAVVTHPVEGVQHRIL